MLKNEDRKTMHCHIAIGLPLGNVLICLVQNGNQRLALMTFSLTIMLLPRTSSAEDICCLMYNKYENYDYI
jgi:hypothetical protein